MLPDLKIDIPQLEPDSRLLAQLSELSAASTPRGGGGGAVRVLMAAASVVLVAGVSWLTGTLPGANSPFRPEPVDSPRHSQAPEKSAPGDTRVDDDLVPFGRPVEPGGAGILATLPGHDNGNHYGQIKPHTNNGNHYGQIKPHTNSGNHTGQTKPHDNNGNHPGQTKPLDNNGNHPGQTERHDNNGSGRLS
jgi:hypothetical protein